MTNINNNQDKNFQTNKLRDPSLFLRSSKMDEIKAIGAEKEANLKRLCPDLSLEQAELLVGGLLGDLNLQTASKTAGTWRARFLHGKKQAEYLDCKYNLVKDMVGTKPEPSSYYDERTKKTYYRSSFNTLTRPELKPLAKLFYVWDNKLNKACKVIPDCIEDILTPGVITIWYQDDGSLKWEGHSNAVRFHTDSFSTEELQKLIKALAVYDIKATTQSKRTNSWVLGTSEDSYGPLFFIVKDRLLPLFYSKFPNGFCGTLQDDVNL